MRRGGRWVSTRSPQRSAIVSRPIVPSAGAQWPVCARCSGLYLAAPTAPRRRHRGRRRRRARSVDPAHGLRWTLSIAALPTAVTLASSGCIWPRRPTSSARWPRCRWGGAGICDRPSHAKRSSTLTGHVFVRDARRHTSSTTCRLAERSRMRSQWIVPGSGHFLHGQTRKALVFFVVLVTMFWIGLGLRRPPVRVRGVRSARRTRVSCRMGDRLAAHRRCDVRMGRGDVVARPTSTATRFSSSPVC